MQAVFDHLEPVTKDIVSLWFRPILPQRYIAGQFTEITLPHSDVDERGHKRWFTLSSSPTEPLLAITTKIAADKGSSFKRQLLRLTPGTGLTLAEPMGDFVLPKNPTVPLTFVAGGIGITPVRSMLTWLRDTGEKRQVTLVYAAATPEEHAFLPLFEAASIPLTTIVTEPAADYQGETGHLTAERVLQLAQPSPDGLIYISGPEIMTEMLYKDLQNAGVAPERLVTDYFHGYSSV